MKTTLTIKTYKQKGDLAYEYNPLENTLSSEGDIQGFTTDEIKVNINHPVGIECQPSYDGTVNLILNDDYNPPRIVNTRFSKIEDNKYEIKTRDQLIQTNLYHEGKIDPQTRLFRTVNGIPKIYLENVYKYGQLKGGNYTIYLKFADSDYNKSDIVAESGIISIFNGSVENPYTINGTLEDERTDKSIKIQISNIDLSYAYIYIYIKRDYSDLNGILKSELLLINKPYDIKSQSMMIEINGYEETTEQSLEELNIKYNICNSAKTQAQVQNMLFLGNVQQSVINNKDLQNISYFIEAKLCQEGDVGFIDPDSYTRKKDDDINNIEYYSPLNIYYKLGYWPNELYRFGIVYIFNDDTLSPVYNLRGCDFNKNGQNFEFKETGQSGSDTDSNNTYSNYYIKDKDGNDTINYLPKDIFLNTGYLDNTRGVFRIENLEVINYSDNKICPIGIKFHIHETLIGELKKQKVKGFFFVRQKRIPIILAQGLSIGINRNSYFPMVYSNISSDSEDSGPNYIYESFLSENLKLTNTLSNNSRLRKTSSIQSYGLLCLDSIVNKQLQSQFDNSIFHLKLETKYKYEYRSRRFIPSMDEQTLESPLLDTNLVFIGEDVPIKTIKDYSFSTRVGNAEDVKQFGFGENKSTSADLDNLVRGNFCPFIGTNSNLLSPSSIYSILVSNYSESFLDKYFEIRANDHSPFMAISPRYELNDSELELHYNLYKKTEKKIEGETEGETKTEVEVEVIEKDVLFIDRKKYIDTETEKYYLEPYSVVPTVFRGDCFSSTVTIRLNRNFISPDVPTNNIIVNPKTWEDNYTGYTNMSTSEWSNINSADVNTVNLGTWVTYKCLSNFNLGLRSIDAQNVEEMALMGNLRSFYPYYGIITTSSNKIEESSLLNAGYSTTLPYKKYFSAPEVPYIKDLFDNRIMFSNIQINGDFKNSYRIFQGLSYQDIERQYGAIVKLLPLGANLFCVFEHGCGIVPVNEKALMATTTGQSIHMYGTGVLQNQVTIISPDYGSIWQDSIIRTPNGIYGVDTYAKKIWRFNQKDGFVLLSDIKVQRFLNDNILLSELDKYPIVSLRNIKTHYNNYKGDVMFTFYNKDKVWNLCYNERLNNWVTKYSWTPLFSENIDNIFFSMDQNRATLLAGVWNNQESSIGIGVERIDNKCGNVWDYDYENPSDFTAKLTVKGILADYCEIEIQNVTTSYLDDNSEEIVEYYNTVKNEHINMTSLPPINHFKSNVLTDNDIIIASISSTEPDSYYLSLNNKFFKDRLYIVINIKITGKLRSADNDTPITTSTYYDRIVIIKNDTLLSDIDKRKYKNLLNNGFYVHGRAGSFDELDFLSPDSINKILPTKWYGKQEPFEFEFVVNNPNGLHKIFNNLVIISNNVEPNSIEYELIGDVYGFNKEGIFKNSPNETYETFCKINLSPEKSIETNVVYDHVLNQYALELKQDCVNINKYGRRLGNIQYLEDKWNVVISPIYYKRSDKITLSSTRVRDKWVKIRVRYSGEKLAVITAIQTLMNLSYA